MLTVLDLSLKTAAAGGVEKIVPHNNHPSGDRDAACALEWAGLS